MALVALQLALAHQERGQLPPARLVSRELVLQVQGSLVSLLQVHLVMDPQPLVHQEFLALAPQQLVRQQVVLQLVDQVLVPQLALARQERDQLLQAHQGFRVRVPQQEQAPLLVVDPKVQVQREEVLAPQVQLVQLQPLVLQEWVKLQEVEWAVEPAPRRQAQ